MKKYLASILFIISCISFMPKAGMSCTTFVLDLDGQPVYGKNMDWIDVPAYVVVNKRGVAKTTVPDNDTDPAVIWTSKYGSVTFNYLARELPFEGVNEAGLFISASSGDLKELPEPDSRPPMIMEQWIQYQLDNFSTIDEIIACDNDIRIEVPGLHFLAGDSLGNCAIIGFPKGKMVSYTGTDMPINVLSNVHYDKSLEVLSYFWGFGGILPVPGNIFWNFWLVFEKDINAYLRFVRTADKVRKYDPQTSGPAIDYAFDILKNVKMFPLFNSAVWSTLYDPSDKKIYFRSSGYDRIRSIDISALDFSCTTPVQALNVQAELEGDVTNSFVDYTESMSSEMLESNRETPFYILTDKYIDFWTTYPDNHTSCTE